MLSGCTIEQKIITVKYPNYYKQNRLLLFFLKIKNFLLFTLLFNFLFKRNKRIFIYGVFDKQLDTYLGYFKYEAAANKEKEIQIKRTGSEYGIKVHCIMLRDN